MTGVATVLDPGLLPLDLLFDADALSSLLGRRVRATHLRWKRGVSAVARLEDDDGVRWIAAYSPQASAKLDKTFRRAVEHGFTLDRYALDGGVVASGPIALDPRLYSALRPFRRHGSLFTESACNVLKYNPFRRVVFAVQPDNGRRLVGRVSAGSQATTASVLAGLAAGGVPVLRPIDPSELPAGVPAGKHVDYLPWYGTGDLSTVPPAQSQGACEAAGASLALLHRQRPVHQAHAWRAPAGRLESLVKENAALMPENRERLHSVSTRLEPLLRRPGRTAVIHGDFSADQVLVDGENIRLIDFERCTYGAAASDLGSFAAMELLQDQQSTAPTVLALPRTAALLDGYAAGAGRAGESDILAWTAFHLLNRLRDPFRECAPDWRLRMEQRLALLEEVLA